jgi:polysaccharide export outer membrane protein
MSFAIRPVFLALCLIQALALGACASHPTSTSKREGVSSSSSATGAKAPAAKTPAMSAKEKAAQARAEKAAAAKAAAAERAAAAKAAAEAKAEAARVAAAAKAEKARAEAAARADAAAAARAESVARALAKAKADAAARAEAAARADAVAKAAAAAKAEALARAEAKARADAIAKADAEKTAAAARAVAAANAAKAANAANAAEPVTLAREIESLSVAPPAAGGVNAAPAPTAAIDEPAAAETRRDYAVGGGDVLRISVFQSPDLSLDARVSESGTISYPLLGQVRVGGLSISQVEATIASGLRNGNFLRQPQVGVLLMEVRGNQVSVLGMANRPGRYPIEVNGMRLSELLALAGGVAPGGSEMVTLSGIRNGKQYRQRVDINALFTDGAQGGNPMVRNGDTLYIDRLPSVYIYGEVQRPGAIPLTADMTLMQAVASGGGLTQRGTERGMRVHRRNASGEVHVLKPDMDDVLMPGDVVYVRESLF